jgi:hypothetical protein
MTQFTTSAYPKTASILALAGGALIMLSGILFIAVSAYVLPHVDFSNVATPPQLSPNSIADIASGFVGVMGTLGLVSGIIVIVSSVMLLLNSSQKTVWGALILVFSAVSFLGFGGFIVGAVLGIVGGVLTLRWKPPTQ